MAVSVRFHREDPWERIRLVSEAMPATPLGMITTGMRFISWVPAAEDVMRLSYALAVRNGLRRLQIADPSNDLARLRRLAAIARAEGFEEVVIGLTYSISDVHTHTYLRRARVRPGRLRRDGSPVPEGPRRPLDPRMRSASWRRISSPPAPGAAGGNRARSSCTATARSDSRHSCTSRASAPGLRVCTPRRARCHGGPRSRRRSAPRATSRRPASRTARRRSADDRDLALRAAGGTQGPTGRNPAGVRRGLLPPPTPGRDGHDDAPDARGAATAGAVRRGPGRGRAGSAPRWATRSWSRRCRS